MIYLRMELGKDLVAASATPLVLAILAEGDSYGYGIIKRVTELSGGHLQWTDGMLYPVLHRLERPVFRGEVGASESGRRRKNTASPRGRAQLGSSGSSGRLSTAPRHIWMKVRTA